MSRRPLVLRRTRGDLIATSIIAALCLLAVIAAWLVAPIRESRLVVADDSYQEPAALTAVPAALREDWSVPTAAPSSRPLVVNGLTISRDEHTVFATAPDGEQVWSYERDDVEICAVESAWDTVVVVYRNAAGCGDVVSLTTTGKYHDTRSAINDDAVAPISSNDRVGTVGTDRVELWRSDLVRTIEYGNQPAPQEPDQQPHPECTITSAMTRTELLAVTETCPDDSTWLRLMGTTPEDSRSPEVDAEVALPEASRLVAIGQTAAAVYVPAGDEMQQARIESYSAEDGSRLASTPVGRSAKLEEAGVPSAVPTADLPHHMTWFDGERLYLFNPTELTVAATLSDAIGTGVAVGDRLLYPTREGIAVYNWDTDEVETLLPVDRRGYSGPVALNLAGDHLVESRGDELVGLAAS